MDKQTAVDAVPYESFENQIEERYKRMCLAEITHKGKFIAGFEFHFPRTEDEEKEELEKIRKLFRCIFATFAEKIK